MIQLIRPIASGVIVGVLAGSFLVLWMHSPLWFALANAAVLGVLVLAISGSAPTERDTAADEAWLKASPDLPPFSDRLEMERNQEGLQTPATTGGAPHSETGVLDRPRRTDRRPERGAEDASTAAAGSARPDDRA